jgi:hypothetical protein
MKVCRAQPPVRREGGLEEAAPDGPDDGLCNQVDGQQAGRPLEKRQFGLVGLKPSMAYSQVGRAGGQGGPGLHQLLSDGLAQNCILGHLRTC